MKQGPPTSPLRILILSYRSNPYCGGQGVYMRKLSDAISRLGHHVEVLTGPFPPQLDPSIPLHHAPMLDLYNPDHPFRMPSAEELSRPVNFIEWMDVSTMGYPEPFIFGIHALRFVKRMGHRFDVIHDNQSLSYGIHAIGKILPTVATIHHPITMDRRTAVRSASGFFKKLKVMRWYSFVGMQKRVARKLPFLVTVSRFSQKNIVEEFKVKPSTLTVIPNGIDTNAFYPIPEIPREKYRFIVTTSADTPLKGLSYLLEAVARLIPRYSVHLDIVGQLQKNGPCDRLIDTLRIRKHITVTGRVSPEEYVKRYARSYAAVVPSIFEGFGLPAGEAMATGTPVISTSGGALPEIVGDAGLLVPPMNASALSAAMEELIRFPHKADRMGKAGQERVRNSFSWTAAAEATLSVYRKAISDHHKH